MASPAGKSDASPPLGGLKPQCLVISLITVSFQPSRLKCREVHLRSTKSDEKKHELALVVDFGYLSFDKPVKAWEIMKLTESAEIVTWPETHYVFLEKTGPISKNAPLAWQEFLPLVPQLKATTTVTGFLSLYKMEAQLYRAGASVAAEPAHLPGNLRHERFPGGRYVRFVLTGPYSDLPEATTRVAQIVSERKIPLRDAYHIENYANDPDSTPEENLITEILFPVA
jgi:predicted transcriptional regulator YdeE